MAILNPQMIKDHLDEYVVGQDQAKQVLASLGYMHSVRIAMKKAGLQAKNLPKPNGMIIGPSGCGKTYLVNCMADNLNCHMIVAPALSIAPDGWVGTQIEDYFDNAAADLRAKFGYTVDNIVAILQNCILFVDEIDKLGFNAHGSKGGDHNLLIQHNLLKIIEGKDLEIRISGKKYLISTKDMLVIGAGYFQQVFEQREKSKKSTGFVNQVQDNISLHDELIKAGMIPEIVGRIPVIAEVGKLDREQIIDVLNKKGSLYRKYKKLFHISGKELHLSDKDIDDIVKYVEQNKIGLRAMEYILYGTFKDKIWELDFEQIHGFIETLKAETLEIEVDLDESDGCRVD